MVIAVLLRTFVVATYSIPWVMEPTLQIGDRIVVDKLSYHLHGVETGNIIVFATPPNEDCAGPPVANLVKRAIGLPGQTISLSGGRCTSTASRSQSHGCPRRSVTTYPGPSSQPYALTMRSGSPPATSTSWVTTGPSRATAATGDQCEVDHRRQGRPADLAAVATDWF